MQTLFDFIIIGSGPAGVSAAFPLVNSGHKVLMIDAGTGTSINPPDTPFLTMREHDKNQFNWIIGKEFYALKNIDLISPKFRVPFFEQTFKGFNEKNKIISRNFVSIGSLSTGGLSNAWGCGVAKFSEEDLKNFPFNSLDIEKSYKNISERIGICGGTKDDLTEYFGLDNYATAPLKADDLSIYLLDKYNKNKKYFSEFNLGRSRVAALSEDKGTRKKCDYSGNCLWGCKNRSLYSSIQDLDELKKYKNFHHLNNLFVDSFSDKKAFTEIFCTSNNNKSSFKAKNLILAAGTISTSRLVLKAITKIKSLSMQSCPTAAFLIWIPKMYLTPRKSTFGLGQVAFHFKIDETNLFGTLLNSNGVPISEYIRFMNYNKRGSIDILNNILSSCMVGNIFLPGNLSVVKLSLTKSENLKINGSYKPEAKELLLNAKKKLIWNFFKMGAVLMPGSFIVGKPGSDVHYSASLPMKEKPSYGETNMYGKIYGLMNVYAVDGSCLTNLPEKSHTLTIMANADRIATYLSKKGL